MKPFGTLDFETDPFMRLKGQDEGRLPQCFAGAVHVRDVLTGENARTGLNFSVNPPGDNEVVAYVVKECCRTGYKGWIFYAHNGGKFDFHFILNEVLKLYKPDEIKIMAIGSRIVKITTPTCEFRDSYALIPKPLKTLSAALKKEIQIWKLEYGAREVAYFGLEAIFQWRNDLYDAGKLSEWKTLSPRLFYKEEITSYLRQDVLGLYEALAAFFELYSQEVTLASTCYKVLQKDFGMPRVKTNEVFDSCMRNFYYGGRVQFFGLGEFGARDGEKRFEMVDINSAFPWAMTKYHWISGGSPLILTQEPKTHREQCFYEITCDSDGVLPLRSASGITFPICEQTRFCATGWEYVAGVELGKIRNVTLHYVYAPTEMFEFSEYVNHFYELKKTATGAERDYVKLFLNGAYGKLALNCNSFREVKISFPGDIPDPVRFKLKNGKERLALWEPSYTDEKRGIKFWQMPSNHVGQKKPLSFNNVACAASITGCVRAFLARSMALCDDVLYCDTDSILARSCSRLTKGENLGEWKLEKECDYVAIAGRKLYAAHDVRGECGTDIPKSDTWKTWKTAAKGVRLSTEDIVAVAKGEKRSYSFEAPNYSPFSEPSFTTRTVVRDDLRKRREKLAA